MSYPPAPTWLEVDLSAVAHNTRAVLERTRTALMAVVKTNAYGLGAIQVARTALDNGAAWLAVARVGEAFSLRQAGIQAPILVFGTATPNEVDQAIRERITLSLYSEEFGSLLAARTAELGQNLQVHLKVDTGFGRLGVLPEDALHLLNKARAGSGLQVTGLYSHLAMADETPDHPVTRFQIERFRSTLSALQQDGFRFEWVHLANSAGAFGLPETYFNLVRAGSALIGLKPFYFLPLPAELRRAVAWKCQLAASKVLPESWSVGYGQTYHPQPGEVIGTIPVGYGDGFRRLPANQVLVDGQRVDVVGRVCNDMSMIRLPRHYPLGTEVVLIGQQGAEAITTDELVDRWHTSQADILSSINPRVPRLYR